MEKPILSLFAGPIRQTTLPDPPRQMQPNPPRTAICPPDPIRSSEPLPVCKRRTFSVEAVSESQKSMEKPFRSLFASPLTQTSTSGHPTQTQPDLPRNFTGCNRPASDSVEAMLEAQKPVGKPFRSLFEGPISQTTLPDPPTQTRPYPPIVEPKPEVPDPTPLTEPSTTHSVLRTLRLSPCRHEGEQAISNRCKDPGGDGLCSSEDKISRGSTSTGQQSQEVVEEPASEREEPASEREEPASEREEPASEREEPASEREEPASEREEPASEREEPASEREEPASEREEPASEREEPASEREEPASEREEPASEREEPASEREEPASEREEPASEREEPASEREEPASEREEPASEREEPASEREEPASEREEPASEREEPASEREEPASEREEPASEREEPASEREEPASEREECLLRDELLVILARLISPYHGPPSPGSWCGPLKTLPLFLPPHSITSRLSLWPPPLREHQVLLLDCPALQDSGHSIPHRTPTLRRLQESISFPPGIQVGVGSRWIPLAFTTFQSKRWYGSLDVTLMYNHSDCLDK
ncbi:translation initiation factor IF-2-like [Oncorhynchus tshawytscha]|uniref:translation initiation factor IF-2-like n=1 Tax=Oncorhynchus tshawytscha TaxID=74940 RepID=UPI001C3DB6EA|nr:translation initiation factor IF-2-like [Oncorhynchus tshawytscha]XP_024269467.2 translation initiation factor IF-2-like [Oncorhynchus tshawytscha]